MKVQSGAEAVLTFSQDSVLKTRVEKHYRHPELDKALRSRRNRREAKMLASQYIRTPKLISSDEFSLTMERIAGQTLRDVLTPHNAATYGHELGRIVKTLHEHDDMHGDLTTSNILVEDATQALVMIDFGLSFASKRLEDRAVDIHVLKQTLYASHASVADEFWKAFVIGYANPAVLDVLVAVEKRGRNKRH